MLKQRVSAAAKSLQSCPTLCDPIDSSPPGSTVPGILPHKSWWLPLYQPLSLCPQPWVLAHVIPSDGSPVLQEPQGLGSMAGGRWHPTGPPTQQGTAGICVHTLILAQSSREFKLSVQCLWLGGSAERSHWQSTFIHHFIRSLGESNEINKTGIYIFISASVGIYNIQCHGQATAELKN